MSRYIDADELNTYIENTDLTAKEKKAMLSVVSAQPRADVLEAVVCYDCEYKGYSSNSYKVHGYVCTSDKSPCRKRIVAPYDFCGYGKKRSVES